MDIETKFGVKFSTLCSQQRASYMTKYLNYIYGKNIDSDNKEQVEQKHR
uniref:Uncharacterized protein n=1 Tax=virus sp. ctnRj46 TaxID=2826814 RepID=A0A8S5R822_9VIRU|nr:MAG TPA: hypothetical protein [virus sp. ctnRj46]